MPSQNISLFGKIFTPVMKECNERIIEQETQRDKLIASIEEKESLHQSQIQELNSKLEEAENNCVEATMQLLSSSVQLQETETHNANLVQKSTAAQESLKVITVICRSGSKNCKWRSFYEKYSA